MAEAAIPMDGAVGETEGEKKKDEFEVGPTASFGELFRYATAYDVFLMVAGFLGAGTVGASQPAMMMLFGDLMDTMGLMDAGNEMCESFNTIAIKMTVLGAICFVGAWVGEACFKVAGLRQSCLWRQTYLSAILRQDVGWFDVNNPGELSSKIAECTQLIEEGVGSKLASGSRFIMQGLVGIGIAFYYTWDMALVLLAISPIAVFGAWYFGVSSSRAAAAISNAYAKAGGVAGESLSELRTVAALGSEDKQANKYEACLHMAKAAGIAKTLRVGFANGLLFASGNIMAASGFLYGTSKIKRRLEDTTVTTGDCPEYGCNCMTHAGKDGIEECGFTGGKLMLAMFAIQIGAQGLGQIEPTLSAVAKARRAVQKILGTIDRVVTINAFSDEGETLQKVVGNISIENVCFAYPSRPDQQVCNGYSLEVPAGKTVALVGASGSGKSTAIQLVERFYDPDSGVVKLDGVDLRQLNVRWLRQQIGLVGQEPVLFSGTIAENIQYGKPGSTLEEVYEAARMANAFGFIEQFPSKFDTDVGEKGGQLSGGQKQRIAIARAMIKKPAVLLLDEATSALDTESERIVQAALDSLLSEHKRTTIVIAHRLSTIRDADMIAVVDKGRIVEQGTHDELMAVGEEGRYFRLNSKAGGGAGLPKTGSHASMASMVSAASSDGVTDRVGGPDEIHAEIGYLNSPGQQGHTSSPDKPAADAPGAVVEEKELKKKEEEKKKKVSGNISRVWKMHEGDSFYFFVGTIGAILVGAANPGVGIIFVKSIYAFFTPNPAEAWREGVKWALLMYLVSFCQIIGDTLRFWGFGVPGEKITLKIRMMFYNALTRQEIGWHDLPENSSGSLCAALATESNLIQALTGEAFGTKILTLVTVVAAFVLAFTFGYWAIVLVALATVPIMVSGMAIEIAMLQGGEGGSEGLGSDAGKIVGEVVTSVRTIASFTLEKRMAERFNTVTGDFLAKNLTPAAFKGVYQAYAQFSLFAAFALLYWFGGSKVCDGTTDFEGMLIPIFCMFMLGAGVGQAANGATDVAKAQDAAERVFDIVDRKSKIDYSQDGGLELPKVAGALSFVKVKFAYPSRPDQQVCNGYSLEVPAGKTVALVGASGSGKSTAIQLVERFYDPDSGVVKLDGVDLRQLNVRWLRQQIGLVGQEPVLFSGTIAENIQYGKPGSTLEEVYEAARMANAFGFIEQFPSKFDTDVGEKGGQLSGGQKQRIAIARAMIKKPAVLLLDEATSALDTESERIVQAALDSLLSEHKRTTIVIAHRLSTIRDADMIAVVDKGRIVEQGTHDELMAVGEEGRYFKLNRGSH